MVDLIGHQTMNLPGGFGVSGVPVPSLLVNGKADGKRGIYGMDFTVWFYVFGNLVCVVGVACCIQWFLLVSTVFLLGTRSFARFTHTTCMEFPRNGWTRRQRLHLWQFCKG